MLSALEKHDVGNSGVQVRLLYSRHTIGAIVTMNKKTKPKKWLCPLCSNEADYGKYCGENGKMCKSVATRDSDKLNVVGYFLFKNKQLEHIEEASELPLIVMHIPRPLFNLLLMYKSDFGGYIIGGCNAHAEPMFLANTRIVVQPDGEEDVDYVESELFAKKELHIRVEVDE